MYLFFIWVLIYVCKILAPRCRSYKDQFFFPFFPIWIICCFCLGINKSGDGSIRKKVPPMEKPKEDYLGDCNRHGQGIRNQMWGGMFHESWKTRFATTCGCTCNQVWIHALWARLEWSHQETKNHGFIIKFIAYKQSVNLHNYLSFLPWIAFSLPLQ